MPHRRCSIDPLKRLFPNSAGILLSISGYFIFAFQDATVKWLVADHPVMQVLFMRSITIVLLCLALGRGALVRQAVGSRNKLPLLLRGAFILAAWSCYYTASRHMPLAQLVTIYFATPLIVTVMSVLILKEQVRWQRWAGVALGLLGVIIACDPGHVGITLPGRPRAARGGALGLYQYPGAPDQPLRDHRRADAVLQRAPSPSPAGRPCPGSGSMSACGIWGLMMAPRPDRRDAASICCSRASAWPPPRWWRPSNTPR